MLLDVTPLSLGFAVSQKAVDNKHNKWLGIKSENLMRVIVPRNSSIPIDVTKPCAAEFDGATEVDIKVLEGEERKAERNHTLDICTIKDLVPVKAGLPAFSITYAVDVNGILTITANKWKSGEIQKMEVQQFKRNLPPDQLEQLQAVAAER